LTSEELRVVFKALRFAAERHRKQRRKDEDGTPYINHPITVADTILSVGGVDDLNTIVAALLHDTIEDVGVTAEEIRSLFGEEVANLVKEVSDDKKLPKQERKRLQIETAPRKSPRAKLIKLADKISNVTDVTNSPPAGWDMARRVEYLDWTEKVVAGLRGTNRQLEAAYDLALAAGRSKLRDDVAAAAMSDN
jgi:GTP diphosphokinase / guanosine-3',5'-bis(diphosphate) 3'-diphosphatase